MRRWTQQSSSVRDLLVVSAVLWWRLSAPARCLVASAKRLSPADGGSTRWTRYVQMYRWESHRKRQPRIFCAVIWWVASLPSVYAHDGRFHFQTPTTKWLRFGWSCYPSIAIAMTMMTTTMAVTMDIWDWKWWVTVALQWWRWLW